jgi:hypothetical protein
MLSRVCYHYGHVWKFDHSYPLVPTDLPSLGPALVDLFRAEIEFHTMDVFVCERCGAIEHRHDGITFISEGERI